MSLPEHRRAFTGRTQSTCWDAVQYATPVHSYSPSLATRVLNAARVVTCLLGSGFIGWLIYQGL